MDVPAQWADSLLQLERLLFLKLAVWGAISVLVGSALLALLRRGTAARTLSPLHSLGAVLVAVGALELAASLALRDGVPLRDLPGAVALDRALWLVAGLATGWASAALVVGLRAGSHSPRAAAITGSALALALHGAAIAVLALQLASAVVR